MTSNALAPTPAAVGRCPGALADALLRLAEGVRGARLSFVKDLRTRLLTLFSGQWSSHSEGGTALCLLAAPPRPLRMEATRVLACSPAHPSPRRPHCLGSGTRVALG